MVLVRHTTRYILPSQLKFHFDSRRF